MLVRCHPFHLTARVTASAILLGSAGHVWAAPPPIVPTSVTPPGRVGRLARLTGTVSFHTADADHWSPATLNYPVTSGNAFWTEPGARADIQVTGNRIALASSTELDVVTLDDDALATSEPQGETYLNLRQVPQGDVYSVQTPRGLVQIATAGRYEVIAGDADHPTMVTVVEGAAQITGTNLSLQIGPRQTASITGSDALQGSVGPITQDAFLTAVLAEEQPARNNAANVPAIVQQMTGCEELQSIGTWQETPEYGAVWYPPVQAGWVPYRDGHWSYVAPYGWTWVDDATWGFAPFHYGRWAQFDGRWGWVPVSPGYVAQPGYRYPAYSPALVSFVDIGAAATVGFAAGVAVGWLPLGPREPYYPPYSRDLGYVRRLNSGVVQNVNQSITNVSVVNNRTVINNFVNRGATTVVPAASMVNSAPIAAAARPLAPNQFAQAQASFRPPVRPSAATAGVTPAVARQFNFIAPARPAQPIAGPAIQPALLRAGPGGRPVPPPLRQAQATGVGEPPRPGEAAPPGALGTGPVERPGERPGERPSERPGAGVNGGIAAPPRPGEAVPAPRPGAEARPGEPSVQHPVGLPGGGGRPGPAAQGFHPPTETRSGAGASFARPAEPVRPEFARPGPARPVMVPQARPAAPQQRPPAPMPFVHAAAPPPRPAFTVRPPPPAARPAMPAMPMMRPAAPPHAGPPAPHPGPGPGGHGPERR